MMLKINGQRKKIPQCGRAVVTVAIFSIAICVSGCSHSKRAARRKPRPGAMYSYGVSLERTFTLKWRGKPRDLGRGIVWSAAFGGPVCATARGVSAWSMDGRKAFVKYPSPFTPALATGSSAGIIACGNHQVLTAFYSGKKKLLGLMRVRCAKTGLSVVWSRTVEMARHGGSGTVLAGSPRSHWAAVAFGWTLRERFFSTTKPLGPYFIHIFPLKNGLIPAPALRLFEHDEDIFASPDGRAIGWVSGGHMLCLANVSQKTFRVGRVRRIHLVSSALRLACFSPNGRSVLLLADQTPGPPLADIQAVLVRPAHGHSERETVIDDTWGMLEAPPAFSPDGKLAVFSYFAAKPFVSHIVVVHAHSMAPEFQAVIPHDLPMAFAFSPHGRSLAMVCRRSRVLVLRLKPPGNYFDRRFQWREPETVAIAPPKP